MQVLSLQVVMNPKAHPQGIWDVLMAPINAMFGKAPTSAAIDVAFFILMVGGFLEL